MHQVLCLLQAPYRTMIQKLNIMIKIIAPKSTDLTLAEIVGESVQAAGNQPALKH